MQGVVHKWRHHHLRGQAICSRILKYRVWKIKFDELDFLSISNSNFAGYTGIKNLVQTRQKFQFIKLDFSNSIFQNPSADRYREGRGKWIKKLTKHVDKRNGAMGEGRVKKSGKTVDVFYGRPPTSTQKLGWLAVELVVCVLANTIAKLQNQAVLDCKNAMFFAYCNFFLTYPVLGVLPQCP